MANRLALPFTDPVVTLNNVSGLTTGNVVDLGQFLSGTGVACHYLGIKTGTINVGGLLQGQYSWDNVNWVNDASLDPGNTNIAGTLTNARYFRMNIATALPGGGTVTVWIAVY